jgi:hypothetical protein
MSILARRKKIEFRGTHMIVDTLKFMGPYARSSDGTYAVGWDQESGMFVLCQGRSLQVSGRARNPLQGVVANCGVFALVCSGEGSPPSGTVRVFDKAGTPMATAQFPGNVYTLSLSPSGSFLACQLCSGDIALVRTTDGSAVWQVPANPTSRLRQLVEDLQIDEQNGWVVGRLESGTSFRIDMAGEHLDAQAIAVGLLEDARRSPNGLALFYLVREQLDQGGGCLPESSGEQLLNLLEESLRIGFKNYPEFEAKAHRAIGEVHETMGHIAEAVRSYEIALGKDPKVGIRQRMTSLRKRLDGTNP